jgi:glucose/arabinose dehydrogenase
VSAVAGCGGTGFPAAPGELAAGAPDATTLWSDASLGVDAPAPEASLGNDVSEASLPPDVPLNDGASLSRGSFCALPGSFVWTDAGPSLVQGGDPRTPDMSWLKVPPGFCTHFFATVHQTRQLRFAPGGDLFVASPGTSTSGGSHYPGRGEIDVLPDDDHDGVADPLIAFFPNASAGQPSITSTQGLTFANGYLYYEDIDPVYPQVFYVRRVAFRAGDRAPSAPVETVTRMAPAGTPPVRWAADHWPKNLDVARDGTMYVTNGSNQGEGCYSPSSPKSAAFGAIFKINADGSLSLVSRGFRNPIALRCESNHDVCLAVELARDGSQGVGREKIVPVRQGDDWGFPCCATTDLPYANTTYLDTDAAADCSRVSQEDVSFVIGHTPFGIDFEPSRWPAPWTGRVFAVLHGDISSWEGARVVAIALDATTGNLLPASDLADASSTNLLEFATGWFDEEAGANTGHGRPTAIAFAPDGRAFIGDDYEGVIAWIAPVGLAP